MFGWYRKIKLNTARALLAKRANENAAIELNGHNRQIVRSSFSQVVYLVPDGETSWNPSRATPVVGRDISSCGLSIIHNEEIDADRVLVGLPGKGGLKFVECSVQHSTKLGFNFYHIGLRVEAIADFDVRKVEALKKQAAFWSIEADSDEPDDRIVKIMEFWN